MGQWNEPHRHMVEIIHRVLDGSLSPPPRSLHHSVFSEKGRNSHSESQAFDGRTSEG